MLSDFAVAAGGLTLAGFLRFGSQFRAAWELDSLPSLLIVIPTSGILTVGLFWMAGVYQHRLRVSFSSEVRDVLRAVALAGSVTVALLYLLRLQEVSRLMLLYWIVLMMVGAMASRLLVGWAHSRDFNAGRTSGALVVVGARADRQAFLDSIRHAPGFNLEVVGYVGPSEDEDPDLARLGATEELAGVLARHVIDEVVVCLPFADWDSLEAIADICRAARHTRPCPGAGGSQYVESRQLRALQRVAAAFAGDRTGANFVAGLEADYRHRVVTDLCGASESPLGRGRRGCPGGPREADHVRASSGRSPWPPVSDPQISDDGVGCGREEGRS